MAGLVQGHRPADEGIGQGKGNGRFKTGQNRRRSAPAKDAKPDLRNALADDAQQACAGFGHVDEAMPGKRPAVIDPDNNRLFGIRAGDFYQGIERPGPMGGGQKILIEPFTGCGFLSFELGMIEGGEAFDFGDSLSLNLPECETTQKSRNL